MNQSISKRNEHIHTYVHTLYKSESESEPVAAFKEWRSCNKAMSCIDPFTVTTAKEELDTLKTLGFYGQIDAAVNSSGSPNVKNFPFFVIGMVWCCVNYSALLAATCYFSGGAELWTPAFHELLLKNLIAYDAIVAHHGFHTFYRVLVGSVDHLVKFVPGTIKEPASSAIAAMPVLGGRRRTFVDGVLHVLFDLIRLALIATPSPSPAMASAVVASQLWMYLFDYGEYVGMYGMYHGPWSVFLLARYYSADPGQHTASAAVLQVALLLLYVGCGIGKMGPWFAAVFNQEWTLPPWAITCDLRPYLYANDFPRDNTPSTLGVVAGYVAATAEFVAPLGLLATATATGGVAGTTSGGVSFGLITILAMHSYINLHMPAFDVWMLNVTPAYLVYNVFYVSPGLGAEPGFDYAGFAALHPGFQMFCAGFVLYVIYGQFFPERMTYMNCYRFWAGNWPQSYVLATRSAVEKLERAYPFQTKHGKPGALMSKLQGEMWALESFGMFFTAQLPHRAQPMALHKALLWGAAQRGTADPELTLTMFQDEGGLFCFGSFFFNWCSGFAVNDTLSNRYVLAELQKDLRFAPGELLLVEGSSFPVLAQLYGGTSTWSITDANRGLLEEGHLTCAEALAITRPSLWKGYQKRGDTPATAKSE